MGIQVARQTRSGEILHLHNAYNDSVMAMNSLSLVKLGEMRSYPANQ